jgi:hypothetical protein
MIRIYSQKFWPGAGDVDDCWVLAAYMAIHAVAPWLDLPGVKRFRELAGKPDLPGPSPGTVADAHKAIRALYPSLGAKVTTSMTWPAFVDQVKSGHPASLTLKSGALPAGLRYGFAGVHQVAVEFEGDGWLVANPLALPHHRGDPIGQAALRAAVQAHSGDKVHAILMPTEAGAFPTHPLYQAAVSAAKVAEFERQKAGATVRLVPIGG